MTERLIKVRPEVAEREVQVERENVVINNIDNITGVFPAGTKEITENGTYDVTTDKYVEVNTPTVDTYFDLDEITNGEYFFQRQFLRSFPEHIFEIGSNVARLYYTFSYNYAPADLIVKGGGSLLGDLANACSYAPGWKTIDLSQLQTRSYSVSASAAFRDCTSVTKIILSAQALTTVGQMCYGCTALKTLDCSGSAFTGTSRQTMVFQNCSALEKVILGGANVWLLNANAFTNSAIAAGTCLIYVPDSLVNAYKTDSVWSVYADQIKPLSELPEEQ